MAGQVKDANHVPLRVGFAVSPVPDQTTCNVVLGGWPSATTLT
jgi:hypothetical protein